MAARSGPADSTAPALEAADFRVVDSTAPGSEAADFTVVDSGAVDFMAADSEAEAVGLAAEAAASVAVADK